MAKLDIQSAYRIIPVHPDDRWPLGMRWKDDTYIDMVHAAFWAAISTKSIQCSCGRIGMDAAYEGWSDT